MTLKVKPLAEITREVLSVLCQHLGIVAEIEKDRGRQ